MGTEATGLRRLFSPRSWSRPVRFVLTGLLVLVVIAAMGITAYRTLKPAETVSRADKPVPSAEPIKAIQYSELAEAPLIVEGRLRVYAEQWRVFADTPVTAQRMMTPHWSYRRWPAEVVSIVEVEKPASGVGMSVVVTKWSDGDIVALDAEKGDIVWQAKIDPAPGESYQGRRTGSKTMWSPEDLFVSASVVDKQPIVIATGKDVAEGIDPVNGTVKWTKSFTAEPGCRTTDWTGPDTYYTKNTCTKPATLEIWDAATGVAVGTWRPPGASIGTDAVSNWFIEPSSCDLGRSGCVMFKAAATGEGVVTYTDAVSGLGTITASYWSLAPDRTVKPEPVADKDTVIAVGDVVAQQVTGGYIWAYSRSSGQRLWMSEVNGRLIGGDPRNFYLVNNEYQLLVLNRETGAVTSSTELRIRPADRFVYSMYYLHAGYLVIERLQTTKDSEIDDKYYFSQDTVVLVGIG
ncbi:PQQ-binding-like beta-propeller repeat protein [Dactylosporangium sp. NPDC051541]|uniref:outer membrane protein assembly factor BamB family protein n=1 Tax=Dactylosporangium sp. NPDC051541 TaxID=3363977 RepID=UPI0037A31EEA